MSLSPIKQEILETMLLNDKPMKAMEIAKEAKKEFQPVNDAPLRAHQNGVREFT